MLDNPVAAGVSRISLMNLSTDKTVENQIVLEIYDGDHRIQVEFDDLKELYDVVEREPDAMVSYFRNNLFDSPEMSDPEDALLKMAAVSGDEGLVTVPPEEDDEKLFSLMTTVFQKVAEKNRSSSNKQADSLKPDENFLQSLVQEQQNGNNPPRR